MENKNDDGAGCLIIVFILIMLALSNMQDKHSKETDELKNEIRALKTELNYR